MIDESKYFKVIADADIGCAKKFMLQIKVALVNFFETMKERNIDPDEAWLISELKQAGIKLK